MSDRPGFARIEGKEIVKDGKRLWLRGVNLGNWMLIEHFMLGFPTVDYHMRRRWKEELGESKYEAFFGTYMREYYSEEDLIFLASLGANCVRIPFHFRHFEDPSKPNSFHGEGFKYLDPLIALCKKHGLHVILDLHAVRGAQASDWNADSLHGEAHLWEYWDHIKATAELWEKIADYYKDETGILAYEIMNEPVADDINQLNLFNLTMVSAIRNVDQDHIIQVDLNRHSTDINSLSQELFHDPQVMPHVHHYHHYNYPFAEIRKFPGNHKGQYYGDKELIETVLGKIDSARFNRPVLLGEFGIHYDWPGQKVKRNMLSTFLRYFKEHRVHWTIWNYKDIGAMGFMNPLPETPWARFRAKKEVSKPLADLEKVLSASMNVMEKNPVMKGRTHWFSREIRRKWQHDYLEYLLNILKSYSEEELSEMAASFSFKNCIPLPDIKELMSEVMHE